MTLRPARIAPSLLAADLGRLAEQIAAVEAGGAAWLHLDVMDGHFVPNLTFGGPLIKAVAKLTRLPIDVHLMVVQPEKYLAEYADLGAAVFTFHPEATIHLQRQLQAIRERGMKAGLALNPGTSLSALDEVVSDLDLVLVMSVNPGFGGQGYWPGATDKIRRVQQRLAAAGSSAIVQVDGGITTETIGPAHQAGAEMFVAGTAVFGQPDPGAAVAALRASCPVGVRA